MATITISIMNTTPDSLATIPSQSSEKQFQSLYTFAQSYFTITVIKISLLSEN